MKRITFYPDGVWTWFVQPRAIRTSGTYDRTITGGVTSDGSIVAASYDHDSGETATSTLNAQYEEDDHDNPSFLQRNSDGRIIAFYSMHSSADMRYRVSTDPGDISSWQAEQTISTGNQNTYTYPVQLSNESNRIYLLYRSFPDIGIIWSDDGGDTWTNETAFIDPVDHTTYIHVGTNGTDRIDISLTDWDTNYPRNIRHCFIQNQDVHTSDGTAISSLSNSGPIIHATDATTVYDSGSNKFAWTCDVSTNGGLPEIVWTTYSSDLSTHWYRYAYYDGSSWSHTRMTEAGSVIKSASDARDNGEGTYMPGVILDDAQEGVVYGSVGDRNQSTVYRFSTTDGGVSWTQEQVSSNSKENIRPVVPFNTDRGANSEIPVIWLSGNYDDFDPGTAYDTRITSGLPEPTTIMPYKKTGTLTTGAKAVQDTDSWTETEWTNPQSQQNVEVVNGAVQLVPAYEVIENFEGDLSAYQGDTASFSITSTNVAEQTGALQNDGGVTAIHSESGLNVYPGPGDTFACLVRDSGASSDDVAPEIIFGTSGSPGSYDAYTIRFFPRDGTLSAHKITAGSLSELKSISISATKGDWYDLEVNWKTDGTITASLYDIDQSSLGRISEIATFSTTDTDYGQGGVGFRSPSSSTGIAAWDFFRIVN